MKNGGFWDNDVAKTTRIAGHAIIPKNEKTAGFWDNDVAKKTESPVTPLSPKQKTRR
jgi:hypothetical protein